MERQKLHETLARCAPALAKKNFVPIFSCFQFKAGTVTAFNDTVAITAPVEEEFTGAVQGKVLLEWMGKCVSQDAEFSTRGGKLVVTCGRAKVSLDVIPEADFVLEEPDLADAVLVPVGAEFAGGLRAVQVSMGLDPAYPWRLGVTALFTKSGIELLATNDITISRAAVDLPAAASAIQGLDGTAVILPPRFAELLVDMTKGDTVTGLYLADEWVMAAFESGVTLWSRTVSAVDVSQYDSILDASVDNPDIEFAKREIPIQLSQCIDRAQVVLSAGGETQATLCVQDGVLMLQGKSAIGEVDEQVDLEGHPDCSVRTSIAFVANGVPHATEISIVPGTCIYLSAPGYDYLVSVIGE